MQTKCSLIFNSFFLFLVQNYSKFNLHFFNLLKFDAANRCWKQLSWKVEKIGKFYFRILIKMDEIKYMVIYLDNSCEAHFCQNETISRIIISPCGSEFLYSVFDSDNTIQSSYKYRTAYPLSMFVSKLQNVLAFRNKYCDSRPFISPILTESIPNGFWVQNLFFFWQKNFFLDSFLRCHRKICSKLSGMWGKWVWRQTTLLKRTFIAFFMFGSQCAKMPSSGSILIKK